MKHHFSLRLIRIFSLLLILAFNTGVRAHNNVVVIPLLGQDIKNIITVAKVGGDFISPLDAMQSISDASEKNPYLIAIAPGDYVLNETLRVKRYVSISGSGQENTRIIAGGRNPNPLLYTLLGNIGSTVNNLSIIKDGQGSNCTAIAHQSSKTNLNHLSIVVNGCSSNVGIDVDSDVGFSDLSIDVTGNEAVGIRAFFFNVPLDNIDVKVRSKSVGATGLIGISGGSFSVTNSSVFVFGSGEMVGISTSSSRDAPTPSSIINTSILVKSNFGTSESTTAIKLVGSEMIVQRSTIKSPGVSLFVEADSSILVSTSTVAGRVDGANNSGEKKCVTSDNGLGDELTSSCEEDLAPSI